MSAQSRSTEHRKAGTGPRRRGRPAKGEAGGPQIRELILDATRQIYATYGFHRSTVALILEAAQVSRPTFYKHFPNLPSAIDAVCAQANGQLRQQVAAALASDDPPETLLPSALDAYFVWCEEQGPMAAMIYREINDTATPAHRQRLSVIGDFIDLLNRHRQGLGLPEADPLLVESTLRAVEYAASSAFFPTRCAAGVLQRHRRIAERILLALLAEPPAQQASPESPPSTEN